MSSSSNTPSRPFYGWWMVGFATIIATMTVPGQTIGMTAFVDPLIADLDLSRSAVSGSYMLGTLAGAVAMPAVGNHIDRRGIRHALLWLSTAFGVTLALMAGLTGLVSLTIGFASMRFLGQGALTLLSSTAVALWFDRRRGFAMGITIAASMGLKSLAPLLFTLGIASFGWRPTWLVSGFLVLAVLLPIGFFGIKDRPSDLGQWLDGEPPEDRVSAESPARRSHTRRQASETGIFWALTTAVAVGASITSGVFFHQLSLLGERGFTPAEAAAVFLPQTLATAGATLLVGSLLDRISPRALVAISLGLLSVSIWAATVVVPGIMALVFAVTIGAANGGLRAVDGAAYPYYFGLGAIGGIRGLVHTATVVGTAVGPLWLSVGFERTGSYYGVLTWMMFMPAAIAVWNLVVAGVGPPPATPHPSERQGA